MDGEFHYALSFQWPDGDPVSGAHIVMRATLGDFVSVASPVEITGGVYIASLDLSVSGDWEVAVAIHHPDSNGGLSFVQTVATGDADYWEVLEDTANPARVGERPDPSDSLLAPMLTTTTTAVGSSTSPPTNADRSDSTTTTTTPAGVVSNSAGDVVLALESDSQGPAVDITLRVVHLIAIGTWMIPIFGSLFGVTGRGWVVAAVSGMVLTIATGITLMLWGAPVGFPGLFDWDAIADVSYGASYLVAFVVKLVGVALASVATIRWSRRVDRAATWATLVSAAVAVVAVTAMSQFHLLSHF